MPQPSAPVNPLTGVSAARFGLYIHFPYCLSKCPYCDFASIAAKVIPGERYAAAIVRELELRLDEHAWPRRCESVFFGGGTPSLWSERELRGVLQALFARIPWDETVEVSLEANPGAADAGRFRGYRAAGVNRLSIGVQSFQPSTLAFLGREHDGAAAERAYGAAREAGFDNVSLDFIYAVPGQSLDQAQADAQRAAALGPEHLSAYALTLDREALAEEVPLAKQLARGEVKLPDDEVSLAMQQRIQAAYEAAGLRRYEVSNYAKPGFHSRHNSLYWTGGEYLAVGAGATGFFREGASGVRYANHRSGERYLESVEASRLPEASRESLRAEELLAERIAMGLRLTEGVDVEAACGQLGQPVKSRSEEAARLVRAGLAVRRGPRLALTGSGLNVHSAIAARLI